MLIDLLSDSHLGFRFGMRLCAEGYNQREADLEAAFAKVIDDIIVSSPRLVLHCGDCFDKYNPTDRARTFFIRHLKRLLAALPDAALIVLRGNHDTSREVRSGSALATTAEALPLPLLRSDRAKQHKLAGEFTPVIDLVSGAYFVDSFEPANIVVDDVLVHAISWARNDAGIKQAVDAAGRIKRPKSIERMLMILHAGLSSLPEYARMTPGSQTLSPSELPHNFDQIFGGHYHGYRRFPDTNFTFIGSAERTSAGQINQPRGWVSYDSATQDIEHHSIPVRDYLDLPDFNAQGLDGKAIEARLLKLRDELGGWRDKMLRLTITNVPRDVYNAIDRDRIGRLTAEPVHFELNYQIIEPDFADGDVSQQTIRDLATEWTEFAPRALEKRSAAEIDNALLLGAQALSGHLEQLPAPLIDAASLANAGDAS